jgi:hypothetical protein
MSLPLIFTRQDLQTRLANWPDSKPDTTWALCFGSVLPSAGELSAIREAAKLCDKVVVARLLPDRLLPPTYAQVVAEAGADLLWVPKEVSGHVRVDVQVEGVDTAAATLVTQALITVLPLLVVIDRTNLPLVRTLRNLQGGLGEIFTLRAV